MFKINKIPIDYITVSAFLTESDLLWQNKLIFSIV